MGVRPLAQVLLGMLAFVLLVELMTALPNGFVKVGGVLVGPSLLFVALVGDGVALALISRRGRRGSDRSGPR